MVSMHTCPGCLGNRLTLPKVKLHFVDKETQCYISSEAM
jgi:hypothetical protein